MNFWKLVQAGFPAILTCGPVEASFQVDLEIYEEKLSQSGDRILSSHITIYYIEWAIRTLWKASLVLKGSMCMSSLLTREGYTTIDP